MPTQGILSRRGKTSVSKRTHGALAEAIAPSRHGLGDLVPVGIDSDLAIVGRHEDRKGQVLDGGVVP